MKRVFIVTPPICDDTPKTGETDYDAVMPIYARQMAELKVDAFGDFFRGWIDPADRTLHHQELAAARLRESVKPSRRSGSASSARCRGW
ncbi:MAG: hypothetical protein ABGY75_12385 [Gemmataceae bacterium]